MSIRVVSRVVGSIVLVAAVLFVWASISHSPGHAFDIMIGAQSSSQSGGGFVRYMLAICGYLLIPGLTSLIVAIGWNAALERQGQTPEGIEGAEDTA